MGTRFAQLVAAAAIGPVASLGRAAPPASRLAPATACAAAASVALGVAALLSAAAVLAAGADPFAAIAIIYGLGAATIALTSSARGVASLVARPRQ